MLWIDIDNVVAAFISPEPNSNDFLSAWNRFAGTSWRYEDITDYDLKRVLDSGHVHHGYVFDAFFKGWECAGYCNLKVMDGAVEGIKTLAHKMYTIVPITCRPEHTRWDTHLWMVRELDAPLSFHSRTIHTPDKLAHLKEGEILIDDDPTTALAAAECKGVNVLLFSHPWNADCPEHERIRRVTGWPEIVEAVREMEGVRI